jgi:6-phospho-beta-glucosidase
MPGIAFAVARHAEVFAGSTLVLQDVDADALELQGRLTRGILRSRGAGEVRVVVEPFRQRALEGADVVLAAFRPGGFEARHQDERIAIDHGVIGQETAGPGGFAMALRSVPVVVEIAEEIVARGAPGALLLDYTNPVQVVSEALTRFGPGVPFIGLCDQTAGEASLLASVLGVEAADVELETRGTNHMTFTERVRASGEDVTDRLWALLDTAELGSLPSDAARRQVRLFRLLRQFPSEYLQYFFFHDEVLAEQRATGRTRAEEVLAVLPEVIATYRAEADADVPRPSMARASEEHGDFAVSIVAAMWSGERVRSILNLPNAGQLPGVPEGTVVETPATITGHGRVEPIRQAPLPVEVRGLLQQVADHAALTAEAALTGDRTTAIRALAVHPLVSSPELATSLVDAYLHVHAAHLPRFA